MRAVLRALVTTVALAVLLRLAAWQWERGRSRDSLLSYTYAVEWCLLAVALVVTVTVRRGRRSRSREHDDPSRAVDGRVLGPPLRDGEDLDDPTRVRVQRWLGR